MCKRKTNQDQHLYQFQYRLLITKPRFELLFYHVNAARSLKMRTPCFAHSAEYIHNSCAVSKQDIIDAPLNATIAGSMSRGFVIISNCSGRYMYGVWRDMRFCNQVPIPANFMPPPTTRMQLYILRLRSSLA